MKKWNMMMKKSKYLRELWTKHNIQSKQYIDQTFVKTRRFLKRKTKKGEWIDYKTKVHS